MVNRAAQPAHAADAASRHCIGGRFAVVESLIVG